MYHYRDEGQDLMDTEVGISWNLLFDEINKSEEGLYKAVESLHKILTSKYSKTSYKSEEWRNIHNLISKAGKIIEKIYSGYNFDYIVSSEDQIKILWKKAIFETLIREGFSLKSNYLEEKEKHGIAYARLLDFINSFETNLYMIFEYVVT